MATDVAVVLSQSQARALTYRIRKAGDEFAALLLEAHDGEAWRALGYESWTAYVEAEFEFTRRRSYQLLDQGRVNQRYTDALGEPVHLNEREARVLKDVPPPMPMPTEQPSEAVQRALAEQRAVPKPTSRGGNVRGLDGLIASIRSLNERLESLADERASDEPLTLDLTRSLQRIASTIEGLLR